MKQLVKRSVAAGIMIVIGCTAYLSCDNRYVGALLFTVALCSICSLGYALFTGRVCYAKSKKDIVQLIVCLWCNILGCFIAGKLIAIARPDIIQLADGLVVNKLNQLYYQTLILSLMCGLLMAIAVQIFRVNSGLSRYVGIFTCIPAFITSGFEHSVADLSYIFLSNTPLNYNALCFILCAIAGNTVGGLLMRHLWSN